MPLQLSIRVFFFFGLFDMKIDFIFAQLNEQYGDMEPVNKIANYEMYVLSHRIRTIIFVVTLCNYYNWLVQKCRHFECEYCFNCAFVI